MTKIHLQNKWAETNNSVCALLRQAHDVLALTSLPMEQVRKPLTEDDDLDNVRYKAKYRYETKQPLTNEAVGLLIGNSVEEQSWLMSVVRAVERAHGIGVEDE